MKDTEETLNLKLEIVALKKTLELLADEFNRVAPSQFWDWYHKDCLYEIENFERNYPHTLHQTNKVTILHSPSHS